MATFTAVQDGFAENGIPFGLAASTPTTFNADSTLAIGTHALYLSTPQTIGAITSTAGSGSLTLVGPNAQVTTTACATILKSTGRVTATSALGSPQTGGSSGGSTPGVFVPIGM